VDRALQPINIGLRVRAGDAFPAGQIPRLVVVFGLRFDLLGLHE